MTGPTAHLTGECCAASRLGSTVRQLTAFLCSGGWRQGRMHGDGAYTDPDGVRWAGQFYNGKFNNGRAYISLR